ncbi:MAG: ABC transporter permease [Planctomycetota bacterium]
MSHDGNFARRLGRTLRFELSKLPGHRLPLIAVLAGPLAAAALGLASGRPEGDHSGWVHFARMIQSGFPVGAFFLAVLGAVAVNEEVNGGGMRATLLRPVGRTEIILAKLGVLAGLGLLAGLLVIAAAWLVVVTRGGFADVRLVIEGLEPVITFERAEIAAHGRTLALIGLLSLPAAAVLGLAVSTIVDTEGTAVATAAFAVGFLHLAGDVVESARNFSFLASPRVASGRLEELAQGIKTHLAEVEALGPGAPEVLVPLASLVAFGILAVLVFRLRNLRC